MDRYERDGQREGAADRRVSGRASGGRFTVKQIQRELRDRYDIEADRKTIYSDLAVIDRFVPIRMVGSGRTARYERWDPAKQ